MKITIYMEGGGDSVSQQTQLKQGMDAFLDPIKSIARKKYYSWKLIACGGRQQAYEAFVNARNFAKLDETVILLVDSESPKSKATNKEHLANRIGDGWDLQVVPEATIYLMVQTMEAWLVADPDALEKYYGDKFNKKALPKNLKLDEVSKSDVSKALVNATKNTQKGEYQKIKHASELLKRICMEKVKVRSASCRLMNYGLLELISSSKPL